LHLSDIVMPKGVTSAALVHGADHDLPVVSIHTPRGGGSDEEEESAAAEGDTAVEGDAAE